MTTAGQIRDTAPVFTEAFGGRLSFLPKAARYAVVTEVTAQIAVPPNNALSTPADRPTCVELADPALHITVGLAAGLSLSQADQDSRSCRAPHPQSGTVGRSGLLDPDVPLSATTALSIFAARRAPAAPSSATCRVAATAPGVGTRSPTAARRSRVVGTPAMTQTGPAGSTRMRGCAWPRRAVDELSRARRTGGSAQSGEEIVLG